MDIEFKLNMTCHIAHVKFLVFGHMAVGYPKVSMERQRVQSIHVISYSAMYCHLVLCPRASHQLALCAKSTQPFESPMVFVLPHTIPHQIIVHLLYALPPSFPASNPVPRPIPFVRCRLVSLFVVLHASLPAMILPGSHLVP